MVDPLSISASIVALAQAAKALVSFLKHLHDAPAELLALSNEVEDLKLVLCEAEEAYKTLDPATPSAERIRKVLESAQGKLGELDAFSRRLSKVNSARTAATQRMRWAFERQTVQNFSCRHDSRQC
ncbi:hypothetical protein EJ06DRAFT_235271 [Trichodelitschia bisporula]|uniref:Fungal N-terminal domain-containing protein n=1 Tax=Trichodelitschia bisporula TaxID=703511 RepID=A0A6G1HKH0_9PEZI|nr:hypothetical protein EJ06DRAFT_235271 [Trichodelitschia bisporula]